METSLGENPSLNDTFSIENLTFTYPQMDAPALADLSLTVVRGEFLVLCGPSGCGKSTLLRQLKTPLTPHGTRTGTVLFEGRPLEELSQREQAEKIGFVLQSPDNQVVTDKVWHELAFGLESLGYDTPTIRRRVAEMASFFGIQGWFYRDVAGLSGGQKQLLNLASVMALQPSVLILDEPTSQLDPIAAGDFLAVLGKVNRELGVTVLLTEHRLEDAFPLAHRVAVMDAGRILCTGTPQEVGRRLKDSGHSMFAAMPTAMRVWAAVPDAGDVCPVTVGEGRRWLADFTQRRPLEALPPETARVYDGGTALELQDVWFRYEKGQPDIVKGLSLTVKAGEFLALLGGNGTGKTTVLKVLAGLEKPYRGEADVRGRVGLLPQDPKALFVKKTLREDLLEIFAGGGLDRAVREERLARTVRLCRLERLLERHPYDLSGGEQQRAALAKILLLEPDILLLDEPTKGLDGEFKGTLGGILDVLTRRGVTVVMVSHDVAFCARYAHRCALFFDGNIVTAGSPREFFSGNSFYTTPANRMARGIADGAVTVADLVTVCGGTVPPAPEIADWTVPEGLFHVAETSQIPPERSQKPSPKGKASPENPQKPPNRRETSPKKPDGDPSAWQAPKLPWWRRGLAAVCALVAVALLCHFIGVTDLTTLAVRAGLTNGAARQLTLYGIFAASLVLLGLALGRRTPPLAEAERPRQRRKLSRRTVMAAGLVLLLIPLTLFVGVFYLANEKYYFISLLILLECMLPFFMVFEGRKPKARELVIIAVLCALGVAGRQVFFMLPEFKPVAALVILSGVAFGSETGFLVGAVTMLVSNIMFSQGPWTPWQMFAMGIIGFLAGVLFRKGLLRRSRGSLCVFGAVTVLILYGGIMNFQSALLVMHGFQWQTVAAYLLSGLPMDCVHAAATWVFLWFAGEPMLEKLERVRVKYGLVE